MKTSTSCCLSIFVAMFLVAGAARSGPALVGEELAVIQAMAATLNRDASRPFDFLYFEADFPARQYVSSSLANPDRTQFCGLTRVQAQSLVTELANLTSEHVEFDKGVAKAAGLSIGHKKLERFRYLTLSRVVFAPGMQHAWLAADLNGDSGAIFRLEKVGGEWNKTARCGGWMKTE